MKNKSFYIFVIMQILALSAMGKNLECNLEISKGKISMHNELCGIFWEVKDGYWESKLKIKNGTNWTPIAHENLTERVGYGITFNEETKENKEYRANVHGKIHTMLPKEIVKPIIVKNSSEGLELQWKFHENVPQKGIWVIKTNYEIKQGDSHITQKINYTAPGIGDYQVRFNKGWHAYGLPSNFYEKVAHTLTHTGWEINNNVFLLLTKQTNGWDSTRGGGGVVRLTKKKDFYRDQTGFHTPQPGSIYNIYHQVPHVLQKDGWINTKYVKTYHLEHQLILANGNIFSQQTLNYLDKLQPLEKLKPRYSWRRFIELQIEGLQNVPGLLKGNRKWAHYELGWYNGFNEKKVHIQRGRQSLDWGGNWDLWIAHAFKTYSKINKNKFAQIISKKIINGVKDQMWQIQDKTTICNGAFWMFRPKNQNHYLELKQKKQPNDKIGFIGTTSDIWVCQTGKIGWLLADLYERNNKDKELLEIAKKAGNFLLGIQNNDGNLIAGRIHVNGSPVYPSNLACNSTAILLLAKLYKITGDKAYKEASIKCADYSIDHWLSNGEYRMYGGEWDVPGNISSSTASYASWGFSELFGITKNDKYRTAVEDSANWHMMLQSRTDTHIGFYQEKAYWRGRSFVSTGGFTQGVMDEGYGQLLWNRPEECLGQYAAWKTTGKKRFLDSAMAYLVWQTYMQHNCPDDYRFHGGGSEGYEWQWDNMNGHGTVYIGETIGCDITLFKLHNDGYIAID